ncbi:hypothetical protein B7P43_G02564 [Cryptotermes secundus]|uniref:Uncharacterized protein n=1 Tax=Cryptotermes secundus TaxID=105785 RepID=A0A2J7R3C9_9NEOP|nr:hypothetical protein B7P43_G02564 [Cryptotermes secundus]
MHESIVEDEWYISITVPSDSYLVVCYQARECRKLLLKVATCRFSQPIRCEGCKVDRCSREYERAMDERDIPNPEPSAEFCQIARDYGACLRGTARSCRGNLNYHSTMSTLGRLANEFNCPRLLTNSTSAGHVPLPSSSAAPPRTSSTPAPKRECTYQGRHRFRHCGLFGDPHLKTFKNQYQTCRVRGAWPLIDNPYLGVQVTNEPVVEGSPATATTKSLVAKAIGWELKSRSNGIIKWRITSKPLQSRVFAKRCAKMGSRRRHSRTCILDTRSFRAADCDTDHYLVVAKVRERLAVSKQTTHTVHMERFNLKELNEVEGKEQYCVEISNRFMALENLDTQVNVNKA